MSDMEWDQHFKGRCKNPDGLYCGVCDYRRELKARDEAVLKIVDWLNSMEAKESLCDYVESSGSYPGSTYWADEIERRFLQKP